MGIEILNKLFLKGKDILDVEPHEPKLDKSLTMKCAHRNRGNIRLSQGKYYTREEWGERRKKILKLPLP